MLAHDLVIGAFDLDLGAGVLAEQDGVAALDREGGALARVEQLAGADGDHLPALRLLLGRVGEDDSASRLVGSLERLDQDAIVKGTNGHEGLLGLSGGPPRGQLRARFFRTWGALAPQDS